MLLLLLLLLLWLLLCLLCLLHMLCLVRLLHLLHAGNLRLWRILHRSSQHRLMGTCATSNALHVVLRGSSRLHLGAAAAARRRHLGWTGRCGCPWPAAEGPCNSRSCSGALVLVQEGPVLVGQRLWEEGLRDGVAGPWL